MRYFEAFPKISYNNITVPNIIDRVKILDTSKQDISVYHPFVIIDGETPEQIAFDYYGSTEYVWIIYLTNDIIDPYYDWPMSTSQFEKYIIAKYGSIPTAQSTILRYKKLQTNKFISVSDPNQYVTSTQSDLPGYIPADTPPDIFISVDSYNLNPDASFTPIYAYDDEWQRNEAKRSILLIDRSYLPQINNQLKAAFA